MTSTMAAADCLRQRFEAHRRADYAAIYTSYHPESPFLQHFPDLETYLTFAREQISSIQLLSWQSTMERQLDEQQCECIQLVKFEHDAQISHMIELALLIHTPLGWRYHSAQKLDALTLQVPADMVDFHYFDQAPDKVRF